MITIEINETTGVVAVLIPPDHREDLIPGRFDRARQILPDELYAEVEVVWTPERIAAQKALYREEQDV